MAKSEWTVETLREHFAILREADRLTVGMALASADKAVTKAEEATNARLAGLNELRGAMQDQTATLLPRGEFAATIAAMSAQIDALEKRLTTTEGTRKGVGSMATLIFQGVIGIAAVIAMIATVTTFFSGTRALPVSAPVTYATPSNGPGELTVHRQ